MHHHLHRASRVAPLVHARWFNAGCLLLIAVTSLLLGGCVTPTIRSNVTAFNQWPAEVSDPSYTFNRTKEQTNDLEYRTYEDLVRAELARLGFVEKEGAGPAKFKVTMSYNGHVRDVHMVQPVAVPDPFFGGWGGPGFGPYRGPTGYYPPGIYYPGSSYYPPVVQQQESRFQIYSRNLKVVIADAASGKALYDVTVNSQDSVSPLAQAMPYMARAAFQEFPGQNGVPRVVEMKLPKASDVK